MEMNEEHHSYDTTALHLPAIINIGAPKGARVGDVPPDTLLYLTEKKTLWFSDVLKQVGRPTTARPPGRPPSSSVPGWGG